MSLISLPPELEQNLVFRLNSEDLLQCTSTSKSLRHMCNQDRVWSHVLENNDEDILAAIKGENNAVCAQWPTRSELLDCSAPVESGSWPFTEPCSVMRDVINYNRSTANQMNGSYTLHRVLTNMASGVKDSLLNEDICNGSLLPVMSKNSKYLNVFSVSKSVGFVSYIEVADLCNGSGQAGEFPCHNFSCYTKEKYLVWLCDRQLSIFNINYGNNTDLFSIKYREVVKEVYDSRCSQEYLVFRQEQQKGLLQVVNLDTLDQYHIGAGVSSFELNGSHLYTLYHDAKDSIKRWDLRSRMQIFETNIPAHDIETCDFVCYRNMAYLFYETVIRRDDSSYTMFTMDFDDGRKTERLKLNVSLEATLYSVNPKQNVILFGDIQDDDGLTNLKGFSFTGDELYDVCKMNTAGGNAARNDDIQDVGACERILFTVSRRAVHFYRIHTGEFKYTVRLPSSPGSGYKRSKMVYADAYKIVIQHCYREEATLSVLRFT